MPERDTDNDAAIEGDEVLLRLIAEHNEAALAMLYKNRGGLVYSLALSVVGNAADAEEVTQEVFIRVWNKASSFDTARGSALPWLVTMTRRLAIDRTRSKGFKARGREVDIDGVAQAPAPGAAKVDATVQAREIVSALDQLQPKYRELIELSYFQGLSHSQIAEQLDTPLGTVKSRLREAVVQLRRALGVKL